VRDGTTGGASQKRGDGVGSGERSDAGDKQAIRAYERANACAMARRVQLVQ